MFDRILRWGAESMWFVTIFSFVVAAVYSMIGFGVVIQHLSWDYWLVSLLGLLCLLFASIKTVLHLCRVDQEINLEIKRKNKKTRYRF